MTFISPWPVRFHDRMKLECSSQRIPRAVVLGLFDLNCDWLGIPTSQKSFSGLGSQTLFFGGTKWQLEIRLRSQAITVKASVYLRPPVNVPPSSTVLANNSNQPNKEDSRPFLKDVFKDIFLLSTIIHCSTVDLIWLLCINLPSLTCHSAVHPIIQHAETFSQSISSKVTSV